MRPVSLKLELLTAICLISFESPTEAHDINSRIGAPNGYERGEVYSSFKIRPFRRAHNQFGPKATLSGLTNDCNLLTNIPGAE